MDDEQRIMNGKLLETRTFVADFLSKCDQLGA
jgi:hypothetical protein